MNKSSNFYTAYIIIPLSKENLILFDFFLGFCHEKIQLIINNLKFLMSSQIAI